MKKISLKNKCIIALYIDMILIGCYIGATLVFPILLKDIILILLFIAAVDYGLFEILKTLRLDTKTNKIFERDEEEC